jgi:hypothetical protein
MHALRNSNIFCDALPDSTIGSQGKPVFWWANAHVSRGTRQRRRGQVSGVVRNLADVLAVRWPGEGLNRSGDFLGGARPVAGKENLLSQTIKSDHIS